MPRRTTKTKTVNELPAVASEEKPLPPGRVRNAQGKVVFAKGQSGNKAGRPPGSLNRAKQLAEALMGDNGQKIVKKVIEKALTDGDKDQAMCLKMCLERIIPTQRSVDISGTIKQDQAINIVVEGVTSFSKSTPLTIDNDITDVYLDESDDEEEN